MEVNSYLITRSGKQPNKLWAEQVKGVDEHAASERALSSSDPGAQPSNSTSDTGVDSGAGCEDGDKTRVESVVVDCTAYPSKMEKKCGARQRWRSRGIG